MARIGTIIWAFAVLFFASLSLAWADSPKQIGPAPAELDTLALRDVPRTGSLDSLAAAVAELVDPLLGEKEPDSNQLAALDALSEDPITLRALARDALEDAPDRARFLFRRALRKEEINLYERLTGTGHAEALTLEFGGDLPGAREKWRQAMRRDVLTTYFFLSSHSRDPERGTLLEEARQHVRQLVQTAKAGGDAPIYTTRRGSKRNLKVMTSEEALAALKESGFLRYVYVEKLDLSGQKFDRAIGCQRCVVGTLKGYDSDFAGGFSFRGIVLDDLHLGKSWTGEVNRSRAIPAGRFQKLLLDKVAVFGDLLMDSVEVYGKTGSFPFVVVDGEADFRNVVFAESADFRFSFFRGPFALQGSEFRGPAYFGHLHAGGLDLTRVVSRNNPLLFDSTTFSGPVVAARCTLEHGATFENALFGDTFEAHHCRMSGRLNMSRARFVDSARLAHLELDDVDFFGATAQQDLALSDSVVRGNARFALDGLNRRLHLDDVDPLHRLYKQYQGDVDSDEELTTRSQYGVTHVDDLTARFAANTSFANTIFENFVGFEGVTFGTSGEHLANFYNAQLYGEAHFERARFRAVADFRTISGNEISFNDARIERTWMLDDANIPGRLSLSSMSFSDEATLSFYGARLAFFGINREQLSRGNESRLFYERCAQSEAPPVDDPRLLRARWDAETETMRRDDTEIRERAHRLCLSRSIGEFVVLRDSFTKRGMTEQADWAYWHLRHYTNQRHREEASGLDAVGAWLEWVVFEKAFGWGVHLGNLFWSSLVVILIYMMLIRLFCGEMIVEWDDEMMPVRRLPSYALFVISLHSFLGRARDWKSRTSNRVWKVLYTTEMILGIIIITFFIGAYARIILR
jgi:hypothetical protein